MKWRHLSLRSAAGTKLLNADVRSTVANGGRPDMMRVAQFGRYYSSAKRPVGLSEIASSKKPRHPPGLSLLARSVTRRLRSAEAAKAVAFSAQMRNVLRRALSSRTANAVVELVGSRLARISRVASDRLAGQLSAVHDAREFWGHRGSEAPGPATLLKARQHA